MDDVEELAAKLSKAQRDAWVWTVLAVVQTAPNRAAFADGYNGQPCSKPATSRKLSWHHRGEQVRHHLLTKDLQNG